ncbi:hypothetical protein [Streptosporangium sp. NPDC002524]|uniref:helix-turn-helix domain-containing protein n=1 Tax=Streptosporangium sp. NPDC002524 TaxID=3154537 RepID=UPI00332A9B9C
MNEVAPWAARLRAERRSRCWSQREMAKQLAEAADDRVRARLPTRESLVRSLKTWESGKHRPRDPYPQLFARAFGVAEAELFGDACDTAEQDPGPLPSKTPRLVSPDLVGYFRDQLMIHYRADALLGPRYLVGPVCSQFSSIMELAGGAEPGLRRELFRLAAAYAAFAGWLYQDAGSTERASFWLSANLEAAHRAQDVHLVSHALTNRAMLSADLGDSTAVIDLTEAALADQHRLIPKMRLLALQQGAHGHALAGNQGHCERLLEQAERLVGILDDDLLVGAACRTPNYLLIQRATCYGHLGLARQSSVLWEEIIPAMPVTSRRDVGVFRARQAVALAVTEAEQAAQAALEAIQVARETGSARLIRELTGLRPQMTAWKDSRVGRDLAEKLSDLA